MSKAVEINMLLNYIDHVLWDIDKDDEYINIHSRNISSEKLENAINWMKLTSKSYSIELKNIQNILKELDRDYTYERLLEIIGELEEPNANKEI